MRCIHCGSSAGKERTDELSLAECMDVVKNLICLGCKNVTLIGGEIFLYKGWERIARNLTIAGIKVNIVSNGFAINKNEIKNILWANLTNVAISIDGMRETHNKIRNSPLSFDNILNAISLLKKNKIPVSIITTLTKYSIGELGEIYNLLLNYGVTDWQIQLVNPMGNAAGNEDLLVPLNEIYGLTHFIRQKRFQLEMRIYAGDNIGYYDKNEMYIRHSPGTLCSWNGCKAGIRVIGIDSNGNVKGCESQYSDKFVEGNLRSNNLRIIWENPNNFAYNRHFKIDMLSGRCKDCSKGSICMGGCRASNYFINSHLHSSYYCNFKK